MADTFTTVLALILQETGGDNNTWGQNLNAQVIQYLEDKICGRTAVATTGGGTTLTQAQCRARHIDITGTLVSDATITVPNTTNGWLINNNTTGAFGVIVKTSGGSASCSVPQGTTQEVNCNGSNVVQRVRRNVAGEFFFHAGATAPSGAFECDGAAVSRASYPELFAALSTTWGVGNGSTTFNLPDGKTAGKFLRARTGSVTVGTAQTDQNKAHNHTGTADANGTVAGTTNSQGAHTHTVTVSDPGHTHTSNAPQSTGFAVAPGGVGAPSTTGAVINSNTTGITATVDSQGNHTHTVTVNAHTHPLTIANDGGTEARPTNIVGMLCVRI